MVNLENEALVFEALSYLLKDKNEAYSLFTSFGDIESNSLPFFSSFLTKYPIKEDEINKAWIETRTSFENEKIKKEIVKVPSKYNGSEIVPYLYLAGNKSYLDFPLVALLGSPSPSLKAKEEIANIVKECVNLNLTIIAPLELGCSAFALSRALKEGGKAIGVLSNSLSKCSNESLLNLQTELYEKGLLLTQFSPITKKDKANIVLRNRFISGLVDFVLMIEEKDGGPTWPIFDSALALNKKALISKFLSDNPLFSFPKSRIEKGAIILKKPQEVKKFLSAKDKKRVKKKREETELNLFS